MDERTQPPAWARNVSGLAWAIVFYLLTFVLWQLFGWGLAGVFEDRLLRAAAPLLLANLVTNFALPRPLGVPKGSGLGFGAHSWGRPLLGGVALTGLTALALLLTLNWAGEVDITASAGAGETWTLPVALAALAAAAFGEELFFRGYGFQQLARAITPTGAALFTGMAFGFLHGSNPDVSEIAIANTVLFGILFGLALVWSRSFWLPYGMHVGWNYALALLGAPISGLSVPATPLATLPVGGDLWDGGAYGPEGGLAATLAVFALLRAVRAMRNLNAGGRLIWEDDRQ